jgi:hypothetical protein
MSVDILARHLLHFFKPTAVSFVFAPSTGSVK